MAASFHDEHTIAYLDGVHAGINHVKPGICVVLILINHLQSYL